MEITGEMMEEWGYHAVACESNTVAYANDEGQIAVFGPNGCAIRTPAGIQYEMTWQEVQDKGEKAFVK